MLGGRLCVDAGRRRCGEKTDDVAQQRRIVGSPPFTLWSLCAERRFSRAHVSRDRTRTPLEVTFFAFTPSPMWRKRLCFM